MGRFGAKVITTVSKDQKAAHAKRAGADRCLIEIQWCLDRSDDGPVVTKHHVAIVAERPTHRWKQHNRIGTSRHGSEGPDV